MPFQTELVELLKKDHRFLDDSGELLIAAVEDCAWKLDKDLVRLLLSDENAKSKFFSEIEGYWVFNVNTFLDYISQKDFLDNSYTRFRNKIGLMVGGKFLKERGEVALAWPYKDCVLEGGQTKEEEKRKEIFFNEVLAEDEINRLLDPKVLTNFKRFTADGEEEVKEFKRDKNGVIRENLIIKGNNLLALHSLVTQFRGQVKLIYIDPPYNTGGDANTFKYNNTFNHSSWLTFMKNRLTIAKDLLLNDGVICIAIDDEEYAYLKIVCDEIFGRENFIGTIIVQSNPRGRTINSHFATCHEYSLFYARDINRIEVNNQSLTSDQENNFDKVDGRGKYRLLPFRRSGGTSTPIERPNSEFSLFYSKKEKNIVAVGGGRKSIPEEPYEPIEILTLNEEGDLIKHEPMEFLKNNNDDLIQLLPIDVLGKRRVWRWSNRKAILFAARSGVRCPGHTIHTGYQEYIRMIMILSQRNITPEKVADSESWTPY